MALPALARPLATDLAASGLPPAPPPSSDAGGQPALDHAAGASRPQRPPIGVSFDSMRAGSQMLIQALSAVPWDSAAASASESGSSDSEGAGAASSSEEDDTDGDDDDDDDGGELAQARAHRSGVDEQQQQQTAAAAAAAAAAVGSTSHQPASAPSANPSRQTHTATTTTTTTTTGPSLPAPPVSHPADDSNHHYHSSPSDPRSTPSAAAEGRDFAFPFPENTIARKARAPGEVEADYERATGRVRSGAAEGDSVISAATAKEAEEEKEGAGESERDGGGAGEFTPARRQPKMVDATLLNVRSGTRRAGHVTGGLSGQLEDVPHSPPASPRERVAGEPQQQQQQQQAAEADEQGSTEAGPAADGTTTPLEERRAIAREESELSHHVDSRPLSAAAPTSSSVASSSSFAGGALARSARSLSPTNSASSPPRARAKPGRPKESNVDRWRRKAKLAEKLRMVFGLDAIEDVVKEMGCWLLRSVLLQGHMYVTTGHVLFYAHMPDKQENKILKNGPLTKKSKRHLRGSKFWFVLKHGVLTWYISSADPYFPHGNVDLSTAISCEPHPADERGFRLVSRRKKYSFQADTVQSRDEWVKAVQKAMFRVQHEGENVKIAIPFETILDVDKSSTIEFAEAVEIKVLENDDAADAPRHHHIRRHRNDPSVGAAGAQAFDSYFFACFHDIDGALSVLRRVAEGYQPPDATAAHAASASAVSTGAEGVQDSTLSAEKRRRRSQDWLAEQQRKKREGGVRTALKHHLLHPFASPNDLEAAPPADLHDDAAGDKSVRRAATDTAAVVHATSSSRDAGALLRPTGSDVGQQLSALRLSSDRDSDRTVVLDPQQQHTYPPQPSSVDDESGGHTGAGSWLKDKIPSLLNPLRSKPATPKAQHSPPETRPQTPQRRMVRETIERNGPGASPGLSPAPSHTSSRLSAASSDGLSAAAGEVDAAEGSARSSGTDTTHGDGTSGAFSLLEKSESADNHALAVERSFHEIFAMDKNERLLEHFSGYLFRVIPVAGKVYISTNHFCFRSSHLFTKTRMVIPIHDIIALQPQKAFRLGHHGLAIIIKGHEELFMEFSSAERRDACKSLLDAQADQLAKQRREAGHAVDPERKEARILEDLDAAEPMSADQVAREVAQAATWSPETGGKALPPPVMFTSTSSSFLDFRPKEPMHITCLTIGSRGDVQPYIALAKGLQAEGHTVRIASHGEYKEWIEGHGLEFGYVGGDPAELMRICVENGMFTVSFIKEGLQKFRDWIDDLLVTSWSACQGTDLIIESPSAMGGLHIAEGLSIPYFRAFTMPWTRTRAYPHAFAVPDGHRGGSYNYMTYTMFDQVFWRAISGQVNSWRKKTIGIAATSLDKMEQHKVPFLYNFSPTVVPPPLDWYEWIRVTGYWFLDNADDSSSKKWEPPEGMLEFIDKAHDDGKKVVYIGFGSIVVSDPDAMTECVVQSVLDSGVRAILSKGWSDRLSVKKDKSKEEQEKEKADEEKKKEEEKAQYPAEIFPVSSVPHDWLFKRIDAACHHGGAGTTGASLRAGIPTIIKPFFGDQFFWADRVEVLGVGSSVRKLTKDHLTEALKTATQDIRQIDKAKLLGEEIRAETGVQNAIQAIYRDLDYARSLIKSPEHVSTSAGSSPTSSPEVSVRELPATSVPASPSAGSTTLHQADDLPSRNGDSDTSWDVVADDHPKEEVEKGHAGRSKNGGLGLVGTVVGGLTTGVQNGLGNFRAKPKSHGSHHS